MSLRPSRMREYWSASTPCWEESWNDRLRSWLASGDMGISGAPWGRSRCTAMTLEGPCRGPMAKYDPPSAKVRASWMSLARQVPGASFSNSGARVPWKNGISRGTGRYWPISLVLMFSYIVDLRVSDGALARGAAPLPGAGERRQRGRRVSPGNLRSAWWKYFHREVITGEVLVYQGEDFGPFEAAQAGAQCRYGHGA